ncbi:homocysteine S-methyltransferase family protein [Psychrobacter sp. I-STPA6b]|uniref:homocysteine S-methyltransferase family protein n=1 Tax=Psychrobacter sp. I-STPA6b TaxID=2585718 RepID=UPI001D0C12F3|nr:homocysteine S-methyltransferase family protein [Psychrobacter sp. I-STPA6b]
MSTPVISATSYNPTHNKRSVTLLDGGMGRELERRGAPFRQPEWSALALMQAPEHVLQTHLDYLQAGATLITINSYALTPFHLGDRFYHEGQRLAVLASKLAYQAVQTSHTSAQICACLPPLFGSYRPDLFDKSQAYNIAMPLIEAQAPYADIWLAETVSSIAEATTWYQLVQEYTATHDCPKKPFWIAFTIDDNETDIRESVRLRSGEPVEKAICAILNKDIDKDISIDTILFNCSQPEVMTDALCIAQHCIQKAGGHQRLGVYANAFAPKQVHKDANAELRHIREDTTPEVYLQWALQWQQAGADIIGGCCGIGVEHIAYLANALKSLKT